MRERRHGLATALADMKRLSIGEAHDHSPITAFCNGVDPYRHYWISYKPSNHITRFVTRVIRGKKAATFEDWNTLVDVLVARHMGESPGRHSVRRSCEIGSRGPIVGWFIDRAGKPTHPISEEWARHYSFDSPKVEARKKALAAAVEAVAKETQQTPYVYCDIERVKLCDVCGSRIGVIVKKLDAYFKDIGPDAFYKNGWAVCKDRRCRAVAVFFNSRAGSKKNPRNPLSKIIEEVTRHAGNNENFRRLEKHFVRHAGQVSERRDRPHSGKNNSKACG